MERWSHLLPLESSACPSSRATMVATAAAVQRRADGGMKENPTDEKHEGHS